LRDKNKYLPKIGLFCYDAYYARCCFNASQQFD
jgi:hypothetical protein